MVKFGEDTNQPYLQAVLLEDEYLIIANGPVEESRPHHGDSESAEWLTESGLADLVQQRHRLVAPATIYRLLQSHDSSKGLKLEVKSSAYKALPLTTWKAIAKWCQVDQRPWRIDGFTCSSFALVFPASCHQVLARGVGYVSDNLEGHALNLLLTLEEDDRVGLIWFEPQQDYFTQWHDGRVREGTVVFF